MVMDEAVVEWLSFGEVPSLPLSLLTIYTSSLTIHHSHPLSTCMIVQIWLLDSVPHLSHHSIFLDSPSTSSWLWGSFTFQRGWHCGQDLTWWAPHIHTSSFLFLCNMSLIIFQVHLHADTSSLAVAQFHISLTTKTKPSIAHPPHHATE